MSAGVVALALVGSGWWCFKRGREAGFASAWMIRSQQCDNAAAWATWANTPAGPPPAAEQAQAAPTGDKEGKKKRR
jgi:hypothetical protein